MCVCLLLLNCIFFSYRPYPGGSIFFFIENVYLFYPCKHKDFCNLFASSSVAILIVSLKPEASYVGLPLFG